MIGEASKRASTPAPRSEAASPHHGRRHALRYALGALLALFALNALGGGIYAVRGAPGVPIAWLFGSPFATYLVPGLVLLVVIGGSMMIAAIAVLACWWSAKLLARLAAMIVLGWLAAQVAIIGLVSWMQPVTAVAALLVLLLAAGLPRARARRAPRFP
jgi:hypothetical protein